MNQEPNRFQTVRRNISDNLIKGALVLLPFLLSFYFLYWFAGIFDSALSGIMTSFGMDKDLPFGLGVLVGLVVLYLLGKTSDLFVTRHIKAGLERVIQGLPILGSVFNSVQEVANFFKKSENSSLGKSVIVTFKNPDFKIAGFLTRSELNTLPTTDNLNEMVAVYIPLAYMVGGGFTVFVHKSQVADLNLPFDQAMKSNLTAWISSKDEN